VGEGPFPTELTDDVGRGLGEGSSSGAGVVSMPASNSAACGAMLAAEATLRLRRPDSMAACASVDWGRSNWAASGAGGAGHAADRFPFDRDLLLDVAPMRPAKRVPILNVAADGAATIDLWCKTVRGFVQLGDDAIRIESGPLPEAMPQFMAAGQCTPARIQADYDMLAALAQVTTWRRAGNAVVLSGSATLRFRLSDH